MSTPRAVLTMRAGAEATRQVGELALPFAVVARELGVCWWTDMDAVVLHGSPLVEDPGRVNKAQALGIDETSFLSATLEHRTIYVTGLVDLDLQRGSSTWWRATSPQTCADGVAKGPGPDEGDSSRGDGTWPRAIARAHPRTSTTPSGRPIPFMWCASPTAASTRFRVSIRPRTVQWPARPSSGLTTARSGLFGHRTTEPEPRRTL